MRAYPKGKPEEPGEALIHDGSSESADRIIKWCGPDHARLAPDPVDPALNILMVWQRVHVRREGQIEMDQNELTVPIGGYVVNPYRGNFLVLPAGDFSAGWEVVNG